MSVQGLKVRFRDSAILVTPSFPVILPKVRWLKVHSMSEKPLFVILYVAGESAYDAVSLEGVGPTIIEELSTTRGI